MDSLQVTHWTALICFSKAARALGGPHNRELSAYRGRAVFCQDYRFQAHESARCLSPKSQKSKNTPRPPTTTDEPGSPSDMGPLSH